MRKSIVVLVLPLLFAKAHGQGEKLFYENAISWLRISPEVRRLTEEHLGVQVPDAKNPLHFAVCDSLFPRDRFETENYFDSTNCEHITHNKDLERHPPSMSAESIDSSVSYYPPFVPFWNETDSLLVMFQYISHRQVLASLCRRVPRSLVDPCPADTSDAGIHISWRPRGRPYEWMWGWIDISFCFDPQGRVSNVILRKIAG